MKCAKCDAPISEEEFRRRYEELLAEGIVPNMILLCKKCRDNIIATVKFQLTTPKGSVQ